MPAMSGVPKQGNNLKNGMAFSGPQRSGSDERFRTETVFALWGSDPTLAKWGMGDRSLQGGWDVLCEFLLAPRRRSQDIWGAADSTTFGWWALGDHCEVERRCAGALRHRGPWESIRKVWGYRRQQCLGQSVPMGTILRWDGSRWSSQVPGTTEHPPASGAARCQQRLAVGGPMAPSSAGTAFLVAAVHWHHAALNSV